MDPWEWPLQNPTVRVAGRLRGQYLGRLGITASAGEAQGLRGEGYLPHGPARFHEDKEDNLEGSLTAGQLCFVHGISGQGTVAFC